MTTNPTTYRTVHCSDDEWDALAVERAAFHAGSMRADDYSRLTESFPGFELDFDDRMWNLMSNALIAFRKAKGRDPRRTAKTANERMLADFLDLQQELARN